MNDSLNINNSLFALDSSLKPSVTISEETYKDSIYSKLQLVLNHVFSGEHEKCKIRKGYDRWNFACPFCRDSAQAAYKKRGNFIFKEGPFYNRYKCFNCGVSMPISKFFKEFNTELPYEVNDYILSTIHDHSSINSSFSEYKDSVFNYSIMKEYGIQIDDFIQRCNLQRISKDNKNNAYYYLVKRLQFDFDRFLYEPAGNNLLIINTIEDKVISFQLKKLDTKNNNGPKYLTVSLKMIHEKILQDNRDISADLDMLSMLFNLYNININRPVLATEGPMDGFLLPNCISTLGANKIVSIGVPLWYVYDDDKTGRKDAIKKLENGNNVFMWSKLKQEYNMPERKKWDINDFFIWCKENKMNTPKTWKQYFTNDPMDILDI